MSPLQILLLVPAGVLAGIVSTVAGLASLVSYPALLLMGLPPVAANVTNTISLVANGTGAVISSGRELRNRGRDLAKLLPLVLAGGLTGGIVLLAAPSDSFEKVVPFFIAGAAFTILFPGAVFSLRRLLGTRRGAPRAPQERDLGAQVGYAVAIFLVGAYSGYIGAAAGVLMLALLSSRGQRPFAVDNALKNAAMAGSNLIASVLFLFRTTVRWDAVVPLAAGLFIGGCLGPAIFRRLETTLLRRIIAGLAMVLAGALFVEAYF